MRRLFLCAAIAMLALLPASALAHGPVQPEPTLSTLVTGWEFDPFLLLPLALVCWGYWSAVRHVNRAHPNSPVPRRRVVFFALGIVTLLIALASPLAAYDTTLLSAHMWQHMLLTLVAPPLLLLGAPITLLLRVASPRIRKNLILPILHSWPVKVLSFPVVAWLVFAGTMWVSHFTPLYNEALENEWLHRLEHIWYLAAALLFWWPVVGADPAPWRMPYPVRLLYIFLQMPQNTFLALAIYSASEPLYSHYVTQLRTWGPSPLSDQQLGGITMWVVGDMMFIVILAFLAYAWVQHEERSTRRLDAQLDRERALRAAAAPPPPGGK